MTCFQQTLLCEKAFCEVHLGFFKQVKWNKVYTIQSHFLIQFLETGSINLVLNGEKQTTLPPPKNTQLFLLTQPLLKIQPPLQVWAAHAFKQALLYTLG